jgi:RNA polymerase sigma-70 factor (ECF subfamily)
VAGVAVENDLRCDIEGLIEDYYGPIIRFLTHLTGSLASAEDLAQETFAGLVRNRKPLGTANENCARVHRAAYNAFRHWNRKRTPALMAADEVDGLACESQAVLEEVCDREDLDRIQDALNKLPERQRTAFILVVCEGMSYAQAAEIMGAPLDTISKWRTRALKRLKKTLVNRPEAVRMGIYGG